MKHLYSGVLLSLIFIACANSSQKDPIPAHDSFEIYSKQVGEKRIINVWLPPEYKAGTDSLPVMYMADGGIKEDFPSHCKYHGRTY